MLLFLRNSGKTRERKLRLFACACCRSIWHLLTDKCSRRAVEVAERFADGQATPQTLRKWHWAAYEAYELTEAVGRVGAAYAAYCAAHEDAATAARYTSDNVAEVGEAGQCDLLRDIVANPFRAAPAIAPTWLAWNDGTVKKLAEAAYEHHALPEGTLDQARLAVLADALEEAGCANEEILGHLRGPGPHVRGCHVVDILLDKT
jgi:hypothetical protein